MGDLQTTPNSFELVDDETDVEKIKKRDLAIKYLELIKDPASMTKTNQTINALKYLSKCFNSNTDFSFNKLTKPNQITVVQILVNLTKIVSESIEKEPHNLVLSQVLETLSILTTNSTEFCYQLPVETFLPLINSDLEQQQYKHLLICLLSISKNHDSDVSQGIKDRLRSLKDITSFDSNWYLFMIHENLTQKTVLYDANYSFEILYNEDEKLKIEKINTGVKYLNFLNKPEEILNSEQSMNIVYYISSIEECNYAWIQTEALRDYFVDFAINILKYLYAEIIELMNKISKESVNSAPESTPPTKRLKKLNAKSSLKKDLIFIEKTTVIIQNYSNTSLKYCNKFHKNPDGIKILFDFINNEYLSDYLVENLTKQMSSYLLKDCYEGVIGSLHNLSRLNIKFKSIWNSCDAINNCVKFSEKLGPVDEHYRFYVYMIIANIATDKQIDTLPEIKIAVKNIACLIKKCADHLDNKNGPIKRTKIQIDENEESEEVLYISTEKDLSWNLVELLEALYLMSVNDNIKYDIFETNSMRDYLKKLVYNGNEIEKEYSLKLMYQLCFDDQIINDLLKDSPFLAYLTNLSINTDKKHSRLIKNCTCIIWMLNKKTKLDDIHLETSHKSKQAIKQRHIMISYNRESRDICMSIKTELEKLGYKIWIDIADIRGSSLESMASAIEESECVIMGMTEKYKLSSNCRLEAEYTVQLNKPIIPLILQKDYKPDGWLGIILGSKMFINFKKYSFEECMRRLHAEVSNVFKRPLDQVSIQTTVEGSSSKPEHKQSSFKEKISWNEQDVDKWLDEKNFHKTIIENLRPCNGKILYQMSSMLEHAPQFFYSAIRNDSNNNIQLKDLANFAYELNLLFKD